MKATKEFKLTKAQRKNLEIKRAQNKLRAQIKNDIAAKKMLEIFKQTALRLLDKGETFLAWAYFERLGSEPACARYIVGIAIGAELIRTRKITNAEQMREFIEGFE